ncbi:MAG: hypothetical protein JJU11_01120 [Candidatus Sumerlaeia bacterium]|nr:hypothetical protein [Candidatus Sumerlaeia bacterium]
MRYCLLAALAAVQAVLVGVLAWFTAGGHFMLPLDDSYIHLQYARRVAGGQLLSYSPGMLPSGGMTSPLYVFLMAPLFLIGMEGVRAAIGAFLFGMVTWMVLPIWVHELTKRLAGGTCAMIAALLVLANGHLLWNFMSGMETGLFTLLVIGAVLGAQTWWQSEDLRGRVVCLVCLAALPLVRPEGAVAAIAILMVVLTRRGEHPRLALPIILACLLPLIAWLLLLKVATGDWRPAGLVVKGVMANVYLDWPAKFALMSESLAAIPLRFYQNQVPDEAYAAFKGVGTMPYVPVGLIYLSVFGAGFALVNGWRSGKPVGGAFLALVWVGGLASVITSHIPFIHQQRYLAPWTVPAIILGVIGAWRVSQVFHQFQEAALKAVAVGLVALSIPSLGFWMSEYGKNSRDIYHVLRVATFSVPTEGSPMAITDAGVLTFYTNRPVVDLVGLTSQEFTYPFMHGDGAVLARLSTLTHDTRPLTALTYREWFGPHFPFSAPRVLSSVPRTSITSGLSITKFDIDWEEIDAAKPFPEDGRIIQEINVADLDSENASQYEWSWGRHDADLRQWPQPLAPVARFAIPPVIPPDTPTTVALTIPPIMAVDGGRTVRGESFVYQPRLEARGGQLTWNMRVGRPFLDHSPQPAATSIGLVVESNTTGFRARRVVDIPTEELAGTVSVDLSELIDVAGGTAWKLHVVGFEPQGGAWVSYRHWITESNHQSE